MDPWRWGKFNENRFMRILKELQNMYPDFILSSRRATGLEDSEGIDFFVEIRLPEGVQQRSMLVPIEVKSSPLGIARWQVKHSDTQSEGILIFHFRSNMSDRKIRRLTYRAFVRVQLNSKDGTLYESLQQRLDDAKRPRKPRR